MNTKPLYFLSSPDGAHSDESTPDPSQAIYAEFDDDFEDEELAPPIGKCTAMYNFPGMSQVVASVGKLKYEIKDIGYLDITHHIVQFQFRTDQI